MLQIKNISKQYKTGDLIQNALHDVSLNFRDNEFVSVLGPSGSGKTTLLNIIGGLDRYDSGDLIINHVSTKNYKDRDWDSYRNHTIGFVFQSYNLIMHQTVLANVELALTIGGISKKERKARALQALDEVGLKDQAHKKPNQMSGGQMQRVAIARALVNNPDILLADEPTGALDTETSVQVMELLKKVAKDRLVIMVTHNPELAEEYSTRIVRLKDGQIIDDTDPYILAEEDIKMPEHRNLGKAAMSIFTAFSLSFNNLLTKKARTILTAFAGSIGIIGIALILSLSTGFQSYIDQIQEETLTSYPLTLTSETADTTSMLLSMVAEKGEATGEDSVREQQVISTMFSKIGKNDLTSFKEYLEEKDEEVDDMVSFIDYQYSVSPLIYTINSDEEVAQVNPSTLLTSITGMSSGMMSMSSMGGMSSSVFNEMLDDKETIHSQYDVLAGRWPEHYDEMVIVLTEPNAMSELLVYSLGLRDDKELTDMISKIMAGESVEATGEPMEWTYDELMDLSFKLIDASDKYKYNESYDVYEDMSADVAYMQDVYDNALDLKIVGVVCLNENTTTGSLMTGIAYTKELTEYVIAEATESEIVKKQLEDREVDVFSGKRFDDESQETGLDFQDMISVDTELLSSAFGSNVSEKDISNMTQGYMNEISSAITTDTTNAKKAVSDTLVNFATDMLGEYISANANALGFASVQMSQVDSIVNTFIAKPSSQQALANLESAYLVPAETYETMYAQLLKGMLQGVITVQNMTPDTENGGDDVIGGGTTDSGNVDDGNMDDGNSDNSSADNNDITQDNVTATTVPEQTVQMRTSGVTNLQDMSAMLHASAVETLVAQFVAQDEISSAVDQLAAGMTEAVMQKTILTKVGELSGKLMSTVANSFNVDQEKIASAFSFDMSEEELTRLMTTLSSSSIEKNADTNLRSLGYQELNDPTSISLYFKDFESKELFIDFLEDYNEKMEAEDDEKVIKYTDITGILMSSMKVIVDSVSYVLIAFVSISLVVSSIMIGIITYISVLERTKEIGVLRAIGASKKNISSIFNAETFIVGLLAGLLGIGVTSLIIPVINFIIHTLANNTAINAVLPVRAATILVILSVILTLIGGLIPSKQAAKKDPVLALRSE